MTRGSNFSGDRSMNRFSERPFVVVERRLALLPQDPASGTPRALTVDLDRCAEDLAVARELAVMRRLLEEHPEAVAWLKLALEINLAAKDLGELHRQLDVLAARIDRGDERWMVGIDPRVDSSHLDLLVVRQDLGVEHSGSSLSRLTMLKKRSASI